MRVEVYHHFADDGPTSPFARFSRLLTLILQKVNSMSTTAAELVTQINTVRDQVAKIGEESAKTLQKVSELQDALNSAQNVPQSVLDAFAALKNQVQAVDDLVPDAPPVTPPSA